jgi:hypothetical protein
MYSEAGRRSEGLQLLEEVMELRKSKLGADHLDTLESERLLAVLSGGTDNTSSILANPKLPKRSTLKFLRWPGPGKR